MFVLALYTGARLGDILYIGFESVKQTPSGDWFINFRNQVKDDVLIRNIKGNISRQSPLHQTILNLGFLDFVKSKQNTMYLFSHVTHFDEKISTSTSGKMTTQLKEWGVHSTYTRTFHSLRHSIINHSEYNLKIDLEIITALVGHIDGVKTNNSTTAKHYLKNRPVEFLKETIIDKLIYGLDIETLH
ncbi:MAG: integrase, partial [Oceanospirillaceae bacterium]